MSCYMCDEQLKMGSDGTPVHGMLYGQKVCPECYTKGEKLLLWLETLGIVAKEHACCCSPCEDENVWVADTDEDALSDESE